MKIGFLTASLKDLPLSELLTWSSRQGFQCLELYAWPDSQHLDVQHLDEQKARSLLEQFQHHNLKISCLTFCENHLHHDLAVRQRNLDHLRKVIEAAALLNVPCVSTFIGRDVGEPDLERNLEMAQKVFRPLVDLAGEKGVKIGIENCPMVGWGFAGLAGNIAFSPILWERMFELIPDAHFGLNFDPSHPVWLGIDYQQAISQFGSRIFHAHAKDTQIFDERISHYSILDTVEEHWWRYRLPGHGRVEWRLFLHALEQQDYQGPISIEHEDPVWSGSIDKVQQGLILGKQHLDEVLESIV